jgi:hypothetical protein
MTQRRTIRAAFLAMALAGVVPQVWPRAQQAPSAALSGAARRTAASGQTATMLADGRWLIVGGDGVESTAITWDPRRSVATPTGPLQQPRAWHTATALSDGRVLVMGGRRDGFIVADAELFDPATGRFTPLQITGALMRAGQTATLLPDGRVLVTGGPDGKPSALPSEI